MKLIDKFILAAAKRVEAKKKAAEELERKEREDLNKIYKEYETEAEKLIDEFIDTIEEKMYNEGCHLEPGVHAILNYYDLDYTCRNGWDHGPDAILSNVTVDEKRAPLFVRITDVKVNRSYYHECLDTFFNASIYYGDHLKRALDEEAVVQWFMNFMQNRNWSENCGLYWYAQFEPVNFIFNPTWGLNAGSFLDASTNGAIFTKRYWKQKGEILEAWEEANYEKKQFEKIEAEMLEKYRNNEI